LNIQYGFFYYLPLFVHNRNFGVDHKSDNLVFIGFRTFMIF
jgi:hypothetical protein